MPASFGAQSIEAGGSASPLAPVGASRPTAPFAFAPVQGAAQFPKPGPTGPVGAPQLFEFDDPSSEWVCEHNLGRLPIVLVYDLAGNSRPFVPVSNPDENTTVVSPTPPLAGKVVIA